MASMWTSNIFVLECHVGQLSTQKRDPTIFCSRAKSALSHHPVEASFILLLRVLLFFTLTSWCSWRGWTEYYRCQYLREFISRAQGCPAWTSSLSMGTVREEWNETLAVRVRWRAWHPGTVLGHARSRSGWRSVLYRGGHRVDLEPR